MNPVLHVSQHWWYFQARDDNGTGMFLNLGTSKIPAIGLDVADYLIAAIVDGKVYRNQKDQGMLDSYTVEDPANMNFGNKFHVLSIAGGGTRIHGSESDIGMAFDLSFTPLIACDTWFNVHVGPREGDMMAYRPAIASARVDGWMTIDGKERTFHGAAGYHDQDNGTISSLQYKPWIMCHDGASKTFFTVFCTPGKDPVGICHLDGRWDTTSQVSVTGASVNDHGGASFPNSCRVSAGFKDSAFDVQVNVGPSPVIIDIGFGDYACPVVRTVDSSFTMSVTTGGSTRTVPGAPGEFDWWDTMYDYASELQ